MDASSPAPSIPLRNSLRTRRQLSQPRQSSHSPEESRIRLQPGSPEVISALLTSLSAISTQAEHHFDHPTLDEQPTSASWSQAQSVESLPRPNPNRGANNNNAQNGFGMDYGAYNTVTEEEPDSYFPDAAIAPVVRMAKPPTPWSAPPRESSLRRLSMRRSTSSLRSRGDESSSSNGIMGTEPASRVSPNAPSPSASGKRHSLWRRSSRETITTPGSQDPRSNVYLGDELGLGISGTVSRSLRSARSSRSLVSETIDEDSPVPNLTLSTSDLPTPSLTPASQSPENQSVGSPGGIGSGRMIPSRQSSLRHSFSSSPAKQKLKAARHSRHSASGSKDIKVDTDLLEEEDQVVKRIQELRAAKQQRDKEFQTTTGGSSSRTRLRQSMPSPVTPDRSTSFPGARTSGIGQVLTEMDDQPEQLEKDDGAPGPTITKSHKRHSRAAGPLNSTTGNAQAGLGVTTADTIGEGRSKSVTRKRLSRPSSPQRASSMLEPKRNSLTLSPTRTSFGEGRPSTSDSIDDSVDAYLSAPRLSQKVTHPVSGRIITFSEVGDPKGFAVFCCVGMGLTRYLTAFYDELARTLKLRLITPDRPGVGESEACIDGSGTPLGWPDDVAIICSYLKIIKFSLLAHSAGAIYALATALRMPQQIRGRIHLMAPWIPPSQLSAIGSHREPLPSGAVPYSQKILRALPTSFLKAANSSFMSATSTSITSSLPKSPRRATKRRSLPPALESSTNPTSTTANLAADPTSNKENIPKPSTDTEKLSRETGLTTPAQPIDLSSNSNNIANKLRQSDYDDRLTQAIWTLATTNANPAIDLLICLERRRPIGFRYVDITRAVVIHHGSRDTRVPVDNVRWLGKMMRRCEVRILDGEGHGLMASAGVMGGVLMEISREWEDWAAVTQGKGSRERKGTVLGGSRERVGSDHSRR